MLILNSPACGGKASISAPQEYPTIFFPYLFIYLCRFFETRSQYVAQSGLACYIALVGLKGVALLSQLAELAEMLVLQSLDTDWPLPRDPHLDKLLPGPAVPGGGSISLSSPGHTCSSKQCSTPYGSGSCSQEITPQPTVLPLVTHGPRTSVMVICFGKCQSDIFGEKEESTCC